jgi:prepilin-type N-terminal cleavage/methylation domain-containing protein
MWTDDPTRCEPGRLAVRSGTAFTLLELLVVLAIIGILASIVLPTINAFKPNAAAVAAQQLLSDIARARQLAISQRTTVYMIFLQTNFMNQVPPYGVNWTPAEVSKAKRVWDKQLLGYTFVTLRSLGDQPGQPSKRYLSAWRTLPEGTYIAPQKFIPHNQSTFLYTNDSNGNKVLAYQIFGFNRTNSVPFPSEETAAANTANQYIDLPYIAFNYLGQLTSGENEFIPLAQGSVLFPRDVNGEPTGNYQILETPAGNITNTFNIVSIDWLTGRARWERQQVQ